MTPHHWRRVTLATLLLGGVLVACAPAPASDPARDSSEGLGAGPSASPVAAGPIAPTATGTALHVRFAHQSLSGYVVTYLAVDRGFFQEEGIDLDLVDFGDNSGMVPALATDQVQAAGLASSASLWNAIGRGVGLRIVLDMNTNRPGHGTTGLLIRKDVYDAGRGHRVDDLSGLTVAVSPEGTAGANPCALNAALDRVGVSLHALTFQPMPFPDMVPALSNGAIDGALIGEPHQTRALSQGTAVRVMGQDEMYPNFTIGFIGFSPTFYAQRSAAKAYARAFIRASREYLAALAARPGQGERAVIEAIVARYTHTDVATIRAVVPPGVNPNGLPNRESLLYCYQFFQSQGLIAEPVLESALAGMWGTELVEAVLGEIGRLPE